MPKISKEQKDNILNYASQIKTLKNFATAVRKTPGQYIGYLGNSGFINMIREIVQNDMDEMNKADSPCTEVWIEYYENDNTCITSDNGRGIPYDNMHRIYTSQSTSSNYEKKPGEYSAGRHGVGAKVTNALSREFFVNSYLCSEVSPDHKPHCHRIEFREGEVWDKGNKVHELELPNKKNLQGTRVEFRPSTEIMGDITTTVEDVMELISIMLPLMKIGAIINFKGYKSDGTVIERRLVNEDGVLTYFICGVKEPVVAPISINADNGTIKIDLAFTYDLQSLGEEVVRSFANTCPTENTRQSSHVQGFLDALCLYFTKYMNNVYLDKKSKLQVQAVDIRYGLFAIVSVHHLWPMFSGQAKEIFSNKDVIPYIKENMYEQLDEWVKTNPDDVQKICKYFKGVAETRLQADKAKVSFVMKNKSSIDGLPRKYEKPIGKKNLELIIVEGDSAMGPARKARDPKRQGLYPLRGKIINAMTVSRAEYFKNEEAKGIRAILDAGDGKDFDISKCKFEKIIFLGDADVDGLHIRQLCLKTFLIYYRPLIEAGRVYAAQPPLYSVKVKGKDVYFTNRKVYINYVLKEFSKKNDVADSKGNIISKEELRHLLYINSDFTSILESTSTTYATDPYLLEMILGLRGMSISNIKSAIKKKSRFLDAYNKDGTLVVEGLLKDEIQTAIFNDYMEDGCKKVLKFIESSPEPYYILNGEQVSLYGLMKAYESYQPSSISRYKGLGEMQPVQLRDSTLHPDHDRHLVRFTTSDILKELDAIRQIESNKSLLLKDVDFAGYEL